MASTALGGLGQLAGAGAADKIAGEGGRDLHQAPQPALQLVGLGLQGGDLRRKNPTPPP